MTFVEWFGWVLAAVGIAVAIPQLWLMSTRDAGHSDGVSAGTWMSAVVVSCWWAAFSFANRLWPPLVFDVVCAALFVAVTWKLRSRIAPWTVAAVVVAVAGGAAVSLWQAWVVAIAATVGSAVRAVPQLRKVWVSSDLSGVSRVTWLLEAVTAAGWFSYGMMVGQPLIGVYAAGMFPVALAIAWRVSSTRRRVPSAIAT